MCQALEEFLRVMAEEERELKKQEEEEKVDALNSTQASDASSNCYKRPSTTQHHSMSSKLKHTPLAAQEIIAIHFGC